MPLSNDIDLRHPPLELKKRRQKLKRLIWSLNSFMDAKFQEVTLDGSCLKQTGASCDQCWDMCHFNY